MFQPIRGKGGHLGGFFFNWPENINLVENIEILLNFIEFHLLVSEEKLEMPKQIHVRDRVGYLYFRSGQKGPRSSLCTQVPCLAVKKMESQHYS